MSLAPVDMLDEDASDLQFPKVSVYDDDDDDDDSEDCDEAVMVGDTDVPIDTSYSKHQLPVDFNHLLYNPDNRQMITQSFNSRHYNNCNACKCLVQEPYVNCADCKENFCLQCFANGAETEQHENTHSYIIRSDDIKVFPTSNWTAKEEKQLLDLILQYGFGNWECISKALKTKTQNECRDHYLHYYFGGIFEKTLGLTSEPYKPLTTPFVFKMNSIDPPRLEMDSVYFNTMAGYRCARGEFDIPYDNSAENIVSHLEIKTSIKSPNDDILDELNCAMFRVYNHRLKERKRRYKILRDHGLLVANRTLRWLLNHAEALDCSSTKHSTIRNNGRFIAFMQLTNGFAFDRLVESLQYAHDVKKYILRLYELRKNGIKTLQGGKIYHKLKAKRLSKLRERENLKYQSQWEWRHFIPNSSNGFGDISGTTSLSLFNASPAGVNTTTKRKSAPLDIIGLPLYEKLTEDERELCSRIRIVPSSYLRYKTILMTENSKIGYLRLIDARRLIKIDVNKTRQLYDFLLTSCFISNSFV